MFINGQCKPQNTGLLPADLRWGKLLGLREFIESCTSRAPCGQADGLDAAGVLPPLLEHSRAGKGELGFGMSQQGSAQSWTQCPGGQAAALPHPCQPDTEPVGGIHSRDNPPSSSH